MHAACPKLHAKANEKDAASGCLPQLLTQSSEDLFVSLRF